MVGRPVQVLSCGRSPGHAAGETPLHRHPGVELLAIAAGAATVVAADRAFELGPGAILRIPAGCPHDQRDHRPVRQHHVVIDPGGIPQPREPELVVASADDPAARWIADLVALDLAPDGDPAVAAGLITAIFARLDQLAGRAAVQRRLPAAVARVVRHCEADPLGTDDEAALAAIAGVSASHLRQLCRRHLGVPPQEFRRNLRLQLAQKLLRSSSLGIAEVATACGWDDPNYFARLFRHRTGTSPRAFRRAHRA